ncbi:MAG: hypothetical protein JO257_14875 [Deltaproteobacteria bacterium]|nr:hypothetical protein [Deltaproteobacteria bacterium]
MLALAACGPSAPPVGPSHKAAAPTYEASLDDVLGFLPVDSEIVIALDAHQIRGTQIWAALAPRIEKEMGSDLDELRTACGFDPLKTVERVSIGLRAPDRGHMAGVVVVHGVGSGMLGCVKSRFGKGGAVIEDGNVAIIREGDREQSAWTVLGSTLIVQIDAQVSRDSIQTVLASGSPLRTSSAFMAMYNKLDHRASIWGVANGRSHAFDELDSEGIRPATVAGTLSVTDHVIIAGRATFADEAAAAKLDTLLKAAFAQVGKFIEHGESKADGTRVEVGLSMSGAQLQTLLGSF